MFKSIISASALKRQRDLRYDLIATAVSPLASTVIPSSVFLAVSIFGILLGEHRALLTIMVSLMTLANPFTSCYLVRPVGVQCSTLYCPLGLSKILAIKTVTRLPANSNVNAPSTRNVTSDR